MAMLQFGGAMCNAVARFAPRTIWRLKTQQLLTVSSSTAANPDVAPISNKPEDVSHQDSSSSKESQKKVTVRNPLVKAAFASILNGNETAEIPAPETAVAGAVNPTIVSEIFSAKSVDKLLTIATSREISRRNALSIMSILSEWTNKKKTALSEFDKDPRFLKLCQQLAGNSEGFNKNKKHNHGDLAGNSGGLNKYKNHNHGDLATILGLTGDDEAAKLVSTLSLNQMIKVISTLARKKRRSTTILRSLSFNISRSVDKLNIKQCADLLYAMAVLNFPDEVLLERASADLIECIPQNEGTAVVGSVLTSVGFLRYKNTELLDLLCEWIIAEQRVLRPQYITSLLLTLATVAHTPANTQALHKTLIQPLKEADLPASEVWLDVVWATVVLGLADPVHVSSILDSVFIQKLSDLQCLTLPRKVKLLNINAAAKLFMPDYKGPFLAEDFELKTTVMERSKDKQIYVSSVLDTLSNLFPLTTCLNSNINTGMGFVLDAECYVDDKCNPLPIDQVTEKHKNVTRIGVIALHYNDFCRGKEEPLGIYPLMVKLLEAKGYRIVLVPYMEYSEKEKLVTRVKYMEQKIKLLIKPRST